MPSSDQAPLRVAIIGFGSHVAKNILGCFERSPDVAIASIFVRNPAKYAQAAPAYAALFTDSLDGILSDASVDVVYVATPITAHSNYVEAALRAGKPVWCEKPMTESLETTGRLVALAQEKGLFLGEICMYQHHRQFHWIKEQLAARQAAGERFLGARVRFSIPELAPNNIRYSRALGGGALLDVGYYPLSFAAGLFGLPRNMLVSAYQSEPLDVDLSGMALLAYDGFGCQCMWAIGSSYFNEVELNFLKTTLTVQQAFSKPADLVTTVRITGNFGKPEEPVAIPADDQFANLFAAFAQAVRARDPILNAEYAKKYLANATLIDRARRQLETAGHGA